MEIFITVLIAGALFIIFRAFWNKRAWKLPKKPFSQEWRIILQQKINFYNALSGEEKPKFEYKIQEFLLNCRITGIKVDVNDTDRILVASSAVIPIFNFPEWRYTNIYEVLLYPDKFNERYEFTGEGRSILGMVGTGPMEGKMILSKPALHHGFSNATDKKNTAIHEFIHLIDKQDGNIDGIPELLMQNQAAIPWMDLMNKKMDEIYEEESDINPYGGTNKVEFFAVAGEYFFERPKLLQQKHPELYSHLEKAFQHDMIGRNLRKPKLDIGRNSPCPCGSGKKFKRCCGKL